MTDDRWICWLAGTKRKVGAVRFRGHPKILMRDRGVLNPTLVRSVDRRVIPEVIQELPQRDEPSSRTP